MTNWKQHFANKKSTLKKKSHRVAFPKRGRDWEKEKEDNVVYLRDLGDENDKKEKR